MHPNIVLTVYLMLQSFFFVLNALFSPFTNLNPLMIKQQFETSDISLVIRNY